MTGLPGAGLPDAGFRLRAAEAGLSATGSRLWALGYGLAAAGDAGSRASRRADSVTRSGQVCPAGRVSSCG
ncbi:hypothetical protein EZV63_16560 [Streptomyces sp. VN1]|nr:hypothetical protein EZV63_16560 [Streptomyces sp. VN1]